MFASIIHRPRQLLLAAFMAIVLSGAGIGVFGSVTTAQAHTLGTNLCGTTSFSVFTYYGQYDHGLYYHTTTEEGYHSYAINSHMWSDGIDEFQVDCLHMNTI